MASFCLFRLLAYVIFVFRHDAFSFFLVASFRREKTKWHNQAAIVHLYLFFEIVFQPVLLSIGVGRKPSDTNSFKSKISSKTSHGEKGQHKKDTSIDITDMRESTSVFQIRTINWSKLDKRQVSLIDSRRK